MSDRAILTYHSIGESSSPIAILPAEFQRQIEALVRSDIRIVPLAELSTSAQPAVTLTFDDGYLDFYEQAWPILQDHKLPASVFLITSTLDGGSHEGRPCLNWSHVEELRRAGITFGAHTATHPNLAQVTQQRGEQEILDSKLAIEDRLGEAVTEFCYPYGASTGPIRAFVREHFKIGCSTQLDFLSQSSNRKYLERLDTYYLRGRPVDRLFSRSMRTYVGARRFLRQCRQSIQGSP
jgi:peptidoglycan/xylan/chitin deacetylase (PgdA/CDA1 family)